MQYGIRAFTFAAATVAVFSAVAAPADPPGYVWTGQKAGGSPGLRQESLANGDLSIANGAASFHQFGLAFKDQQPAVLRFRLFCVFRSIQNNDAEQEGPYSTEQCPTAGSNVSAAVLAFRVQLEGSDASKYTLKYDCNEGGTEMRKKAGEWCGTPTLEGNRWLQSMRISLRRN